MTTLKKTTKKNAQYVYLVGKARMKIVITKIIKI